MPEKLIVLVFAPYFPPAYLGGGPIRTLSAMAMNSPDDFIPMVITSDRDLGESKPLPVVHNKWTKHRGVSVYYASKSLRHSVSALLEARRMQPDMVYLSSFFSLRSSIIPQLLMLLGFLRPQTVGIAPRGEFGTGALSLKSTKKRIYLQMYRRTGLADKINWHASSDLEKSDILRSVGGRTRVFTRENDTDLAKYADVPMQNESSILRAVFVGRIVPIKGLLTLLEGLRSCTSPLTLDVYGPEEDAEYSNLCKNAAKHTPDHVKVSFKGAVQNSEIREALPGYDVMLFPTLGENFGHVIAESLSAACPVICADVTPWTDRLLRGGGRIVSSNTPSEWSAAIAGYSNLSLQERAEARKMAANVYASWRAETSTRHIFSMLRKDGVDFNKRRHNE